MNYTPRERVMAALRREEPDRIPYCELAVDQMVAAQILGEPIPETMLDRETNPRTVEEELALSQHMGRDNLTVVVRAPIFAHKERGIDGRPFYREGMIATEGDLERIELPDPHAEEMYRQVESVVRHRGEYPVFAGTRAGIFPTVLSLGYERFCYLLFDNPSLIEKVMDMYFSWEEVVVERLCEMGVDVIWTTDDLAWKAGPMFSPEVFRAMVMPRMRRVAEKITVPWVHHSDGNLMPILGDLLSLGITGLHPIEPGPMDLARMKREYGHRVCLLGNINLNTLGLGTPEQVEEEVRTRIREAGPGGGYIVTSANSIASYCRAENVLAMARAVRKYGTYPLKLNGNGDVS